MPTPAPRSEPMPGWATLLVVMLALVAVLVAVPWIFMSWAMATSCAPMMGQMMEMMPGMMR